MQRTERLRIGDLARATNTKVETIRYYELSDVVESDFNHHVREPRVLGVVQDAVITDDERAFGRRVTPGQRSALG